MSSGPVRYGVRCPVPGVWLQGVRSGGWWPGRRLVGVDAFSRGGRAGGGKCEAG